MLILDGFDERTHFLLRCTSDKMNTELPPTIYNVNVDGMSAAGYPNRLHLTINTFSINNESHI